MSTLAGGFSGFAAAPANADGAGETGASACGGSYCAQVTYTGTAAPSGDGGSGGYVSSVPPLCHYEVWGDPKTVDKEVQDFYDLGHFSGAESIRLYGEKKEFEEAAKGKGADATWYKMVCSVDITDPRAIEYAGESVTLSFGAPMARMARLIPNGTPPPQPLVDPEVLRDAAYEALDIPEPTISRNPEIAGSAATLVNLDTFFWADAYRDTWDITASVGPVSATVVAKAEGWVLTSPAGGTSCSQEQFTTPWVDGMGAGQGCSLTFTRSSGAYGAGFPVRATTTWSATWTGTPAPTAPQPLPSVTTGDTVEVPVAESQAVVQRVG